MRLPRRRALLLLVLHAGAVYGALAAGVRVSHSVLPGNEVRLPGPVASLPLLSAPTPEAGDRINFLVLGIDHRPGLRNENPAANDSNGDDLGRSDTIAVLSIDPQAKTAAILSIPRDLWLEIPDGHGGWTFDRINEAYHTGEANNLPGRGPGSTSAALLHNFGIVVDHYIVLDFAGFTDLIDAAGGIDLDVPESITATVLPKQNDGGYEYTFLAGRQHLNGELALAYARFRTDSQGDLGRVLRQQQVALAARERVLSLGWLGRAPALWDKYNAAFQTDLHTYQVPGFALLARQIESRGYRTRSLGEPGATTEVILPQSGADVLYPDPSIVARIVGAAFDDTRMRDAAYTRLSALYPDGEPVPSKTTADDGATTGPRHLGAPGQRRPPMVSP